MVGILCHVGVSLDHIEVVLRAYTVQHLNDQNPLTKAIKPKRGELAKMGRLIGMGMVTTEPSCSHSVPLMDKKNVIRRAFGAAQRSLPLHCGLVHQFVFYSTKASDHKGTGGLPSRVTPKATVFFFSRKSPPPTCISAVSFVVCSL